MKGDLTNFVENYQNYIFKHIPQEKVGWSI